MKFDPKALNEAIHDLQAQRLSEEIHHFLLTAPRDIGLIYKLYMDKAERRAKFRKSVIRAVGGFIAGWLLWRTFVWWMYA